MSTKQTSDSATVVPEPRALRWGGWIVVIGGSLTVLIGLAAVFWLPTLDALVGDFSGGNLQRARADIRSSGLKLATGVGAATAGLLAWGRLDLSRQQHRLDEQSKQDERFARSVELLGSDNRSVRLGALYALEALAKDGYANQTVYDVITAYARTATVDTFEPHVGDGTQELEDDWDGGTLPELQGDPPTAEDVEAAIKVCLRSPSGTHLDLRGVMISRRNLANLSTADLAGAFLVDCTFEDGALRDVSFVGATILRGRFRSVSVEDCRFERATLTDCSLDGVTISGTLLASASFERCSVGRIESDPTSSVPSSSVGPPRNGESHARPSEPKEARG